MSENNNVEPVKIEYLLIPNTNDEKSSYMVEWYKKNKEKHLNKLKSKVVCECGASIASGNRLRHLTTPKHKKLIEKKNI
jgi:hypothetical protein